MRRRLRWLLVPLLLLLVALCWPRRTPLSGVPLMVPAYLLTGVTGDGRILLYPTLSSPLALQSGARDPVKRALEELLDYPLWRWPEWLGLVHVTPEARTAVPLGTRLRGLAHQGNTIVVDLTHHVTDVKSVEMWYSRHPRLRGRCGAVLLAQLVYTASGADPDQGVQILVDGSRATCLGSATADISRPRFRSEFASGVVADAGPGAVAPPPATAH